MKRKLRYAHISAPIEMVEHKDTATGVVTKRPVVGAGTTLRKHADRRMRLTMERIQHGMGRGARRRRRLP